MERNLVTTTQADTFSHGLGRVGYLKNYLIDGTFQREDKSTETCYGLNDWTWIDGHIAYSEFNGINIVNNTFKEVSFLYTSFRTIRFENCEFIDCNFMNCEFMRCGFHENLTFSHCVIWNTDFRDVSFSLRSLQFCNHPEALITSSDIDLFNGHMQSSFINNSHFPFTSYEAMNKLMNGVYEVVAKLHVCTACKDQYKF